MKKSIATAVATLACATGFGQGTINFANLAPASGLNAPVHFGAGATKPSGPAYLAELLVGLDAGSLVTVATTPFLSGGGAGYFNGGVVVIPFVPGGGTAWFQVRAWDVTTGATFAQAQASGFSWGRSSVFSVVTGNPGAIPPGVPAALVGLNSFTIGGCLGSFWGFTLQPTNQTVEVGDKAVFNVGATACPSPSYQWYFNGAPIPGANSSSYQITRAQLTDAGSYYAVLSHPYWGVHVSQSATLTVVPAPIITSGPQSQTAEMGATVRLGVVAEGFPPLTYLWIFNGTIALTPTTTNCTLLLTNVQQAQIGAYTVVVSGAGTSAPAMLNIIVPVERRWVPGLCLTGQPGNALNLDATETLVPTPNWAAFDSVMLANSPQWYFDLSTPQPARRFYRAWQTGTPSVIPSLGLHLTPALTLTGSAGSNVRVEGINQFGPTDAWFTLDTVTLTNTSQLYFDTSAIGQPPRLYRLVQVP